MKRYAIPFLVIALVATAAFAWRTTASHHEPPMLNSSAESSEKAAQNQPVETTAQIPDTVKPTKRGKAKAIADDAIIYRLFPKLVTKSGMPDSIRPSDFTERSAPKPWWMKGDPLITHDALGNEILDTSSMGREYYQRMFIYATVMKMIDRHMVTPLGVDELSRCPSGYYFSDNCDYLPGTRRAIRHPKSDPWEYGVVNFGMGCDDTMLCKYRIQYPARIVEMKDPIAPNYVSLRTYELAKFGNSVADAIHQTGREQ